MAKADLTGILLESGTNELEVLVFGLGGQRFGVNVAKVREVIEPSPVTVLPEMHEKVMGMFRLRDSVIPLINLPKCLGTPEPKSNTAGNTIVMEFNEYRVGFFVDEVNYIHRVNVSGIQSLPDLEGVRDAPVTYIVKIDEDLIPMIDFERIVFDISGFDMLAIDPATAEQKEHRSKIKILLAEDSHTMRRIIQENLGTAGYTDVTGCTDGLHAWETLEADLDEHGGVTSFDFLVSDIEMPKMDGLKLTRTLKEHQKLKHIPVVVCSSIASPDNEKKCKAVGADAQITKPQLNLLVDLVDKLLAEAGGSISERAERSQVTSDGTQEVCPV